MRHALSRLSAALLVCVLLPAGSAVAQSQGQPGWVDPPAKAAAPKAATPRSAEPKSAAPKPDATPAPSTADAPKTEPAETLPARRTAERPSRRKEASRRGLHRTSRTVAAPEPAPPASDGRLVEWAGAAQGLARDYLDSVSAPGPAMLAATPRFYAARVRFHGRSMTLAALTAEKRRFVQRWPERRYEPRSGMQTACSPTLALCRVETVFDFHAENPAKGLRSQGVSTVTFEVSFASGRPLIVAETSRVLRRDGPVSALGASRRPV